MLHCKARRKCGFNVERSRVACFKQSTCMTSRWMFYKATLPIHKNVANKNRFQLLVIRPATEVVLWHRDWPQRKMLQNYSVDQQLESIISIYIEWHLEFRKDIGKKTSQKSTTLHQKNGAQHPIESINPWVGAERTRYVGWPVRAAKTSEGRRSSSNWNSHFEHKHGGVEDDVSFQLCVWKINLNSPLQIIWWFV